MGIDKNKISLKEAAELTGYHPDYLSQLIRKKILVGERIGRTWITSKEDVEAYLASKKFVSGEKAFLSSSRNFTIVAWCYAVLFFLLIITALFFLFRDVKSIERFEVKEGRILDGTSIESF